MTADRTWSLAFAAGFHWTFHSRQATSFILYDALSTMFGWEWSAQKCPTTSRRLSFPFAESRGQLLRTVEDATKRWERSDMVELIVDQIGARRDGNETLWRMNLLDRKNKHNDIVVAVGAFDIRKLCLEVSGSKFEMLDCRLIAGEPSPVPVHFSASNEVKLNFELVNKPSLMFGESGLDDRPLLEVLQQMIEDTHSAISAFMEYVRTHDGNDLA